MSAPNSSDEGFSPELPLLEAVERLGRIGSFEWVPASDERRWSENLFRIFGLEPGETSPSREFGVGRVHPDDRARVEAAMERFARTGEAPPSIDYRFVRPDGAIRHFRATTAMVAGAQPGQRLIGLVQDVTDQRHAEREIAAHVAVSEALATWESIEQGATSLLRSLAGAMDFEAGVLWLPQERVLSAPFVWRSSGIDSSEFESVTRQLCFPRGVGLPGRAWESQHAISSAKSSDGHDFERRAATDFCGALAFPAVHDGETVAVLEFYSREDPNMTDRMLRSLAGIGYELGRFLGRRRGELGPTRPLSPRELEVLQHAADGHSAPEIAERLVVSPSTIKTHFVHIYEKLGVSDRAAAVATAMRLGMIE